MTFTTISMIIIYCVGVKNCAFIVVCDYDDHNNDNNNKQGQFCLTTSQ